MEQSLEQLTKNIPKGRKQPDDQLFVNGDLICGKLGVQGIFDIDDEALCHKEYSPFACEVPGCMHTSQTLLESEEHYRSRHHFECAQCHKHLASSHLLDLHLCEAHDAFFALQAERKPSFGCYVEDCGVKTWNAKERMQHCIEEHNFPKDFRYNESQSKKKGKNSSKENSMEVEPTSSKPRRKAGKQNPGILGGRGRGRGRGVLNWYQRGSNPSAAGPNDISMKDMEEALDCDM
ncbi:hypothetical protein B566_EDAN014568 [Ephemera danica]|nr:hypothetical protein B566_EDAN014568 [Ephemera danica]